MSTSRNTHPLNVSYLVVGLVFLGLSGSWALRQIGLVDLSEVQWLFPATLVAAGLIGIVAMVAKGLSRRDDDDEPQYPVDHSTEYTTEHTTDQHNEGELR